jgi:hypothetical protein
MNPTWAADVRLRQRSGRGYLVRGADAFELNEVGTFIWKQCDGSLNAEQIADRLAKEYQLSAEQARLDTNEYLAELRRLRVVRSD